MIGKGNPTSQPNMAYFTLPGRRERNNRMT
jgi:hypothetical protein